jgi:hypothetical protein
MTLPSFPPSPTVGDLFTDTFGTVWEYTGQPYNPWQRRIVSATNETIYKKARVHGRVRPKWAPIELWRRARTVPVIDFDFTSGSMLERASGADIITFTRTSSAWGWNGKQFVEFAANAPRIVVDQETGLRGLLVEGERTNLIANSRNLADVGSGWIRSPGLTVVTNSTSIFGDNGVGTLDIPGSTVTHAHRPTTCTPNTQYTLSFYVRLGTMPASDFKFAVRDDTGGVFIEENIVPNITASADEWRRVVYTFTTPAGCVLVRPYVYRSLAVSGGTISFDQVQLEAGNGPTSPIITSGTALTRASDMASVIVGAIPIALQPITLYARSIRYYTPAGEAWHAVLWDNVSEQNRIQYRGSDNIGNVNSTAVVNGAVAASTAIEQASNGIVRQAVTWAINDTAESLNGNSVRTATPASLPTVNRIEIGKSVGASGFLNAPLLNLTIWLGRLPNASIEALTA